MLCIFRLREHNKLPQKLTTVTMTALTKFDTLALCCILAATLAGINLSTMRPRMEFANFCKLCVAHALDGLLQEFTDHFDEGHNRMGFPPAGRNARTVPPVGLGGN